MGQKFPIVVLISGRGSNLRALLEGAGPEYQVIGIISDNPEAVGLTYGTQYSVPTHSVARTDFPHKHDHRAALYRAVRELNPSIVALAGFMQIVEPQFVEEYYGRLVNIHPSLLPKYAGLHTHERVLEAGERTHGCTVHFLDRGVDTGPIIAQGQCECKSEDTPDTLAARVLQVEHALYPWVIRCLARGYVSLRERSVEYHTVMREEASRMGFQLSDEKRKG